MIDQAKETLTSSNYHSRNSNLQYMSVSQFKEFNECEAKAMAKLSGAYIEPSSNALIVGSYVHTAFESDEAFQKFVEENNGSIFKSRGGKYSDFECADQMIEALKNDRFAMFALEGEKEQIYTAHLFGTKWKIKVDSINHQRRIFTDIKTTQDIHKRYWSTKYDEWVSFIEAWDYVLQMAIYRRVLQENFGHLYTPYIVAVTKENHPNKAVLHFDESRFEFEYEYIEMKMERVLAVKSGKEEPRRCEKCEFCRSTKTLKDTMEIGELIHV